jgi:hypothetical protein
MGNIEDRLRAADPVAGRPYSHPDLDAMVSRITTPSTARLDPQWRLFKMRMASAVAFASLVTLGAVVTLQGAGPSLPILAFGAASTAAPSAANSTMMINEKFQFTAGPNLSSAPSLGAAYRLQLPRDSAGEVSRLASIFHVSGAPRNVGGDRTDWIVTDPAGDTLEYETYDGVPDWYYTSASSMASSPATGGPTISGASGLAAGDGAGGPVPAHSTLENDVERYLAKLNYGYSLAHPTFSTEAASSDSDSTTTTSDEETVSYVVVVNGAPTNQSAQFTVDSSNGVVNASGPAFGVGSGTNYPLQSPVDGVAMLNAQQAQQFGAVTDTVKQEGTNGGGYVGAPGSMPPTTTGTSSPPLVTVSLVGVTLTLATYRLHDGSAWLIPVYSYTGTAASDHGGSYSGDWSTVAIDPTYVHLDTTSTGTSPPR